MEYIYNTPLMKSCINNDNISIIQSHLENNMDINETNKRNISALLYACKYCSIDIIKMLINKGANINNKDKKWHTAFYWTIRYRQDNVSDIINILMDNKGDINVLSKKGSTILKCAVKYGDEKTIKILIEHKININNANKQGHTILMTACNINNITMIKILLKNKAHINAQASDKQTALSIAIKNIKNTRSHQMIKLLINNKAILNGKKRLNLLMLSMKELTGQLLMDTIKILIKEKSDINTNEKKNTPLISAINISDHNLSLDVMHLLLYYKADANYFDPLIIATNMDHPNSILDKTKLLLDHKADPNIYVNHDILLVNIIKKINIPQYKLLGIPLINMLIEYKANINIKNNSPLENAINCNSYEIIKILINNGTKIDAYNNILCCAVLHQTNIFDILLDNKANINIKNDEGYTPLSYIVRYGYLENDEKIENTIKYLVERNADINILDNLKRSPLRIYIEYNTNFNKKSFSKIFKLLHRRKTNLNVEDENGYNVLVMACSLKYMPYFVIKMLLDNKADVNKKNRNNETSLMIEKNHDIIKLLLINNANINDQNNEGMTKLMMIASDDFNISYSLNIIKLLIEYNADINIKNIFNETAYTLMSKKYKNNENRDIQMGLYMLKNQSSYNN